MAAGALVVAGLLQYAQRTTFRSDPFADRVELALERPAVRTAVARRLTNVVIAVRPNLLTARPLIAIAAGRVVETPAFRALVRQAALDAHRSAFGAEVDSPLLRVRAAGVLLAEVLQGLRPELVPRIPPSVSVRVGRIKGGVDGFFLGLAQAADDARRWKAIALALALVFAIAALAVSETRRAGVFRLGCALMLVGALVLLGCAVAPGAASSGLSGLDGDAVREVVHVWLDPLTPWAGAVALVGFVTALAAASVVHAVRVAPVTRRLALTVAGWWRAGRGRLALAGLALAVGAVMVLWPRATIAAGVRIVGAIAVLAALTELLALASGPPGAAPRVRRPGRSDLLRIGAVAGGMAVGVIAVAGLASAGEEPEARPTGGCNGAAALCGRRLDEIALLGTHNSMAADGEPGWLFAAQDAGIPQQLEDGVRALLVDTHYGFATRRGVLTDLSGETKSRAKLVDELGERFVLTAERLRGRIGSAPTGERDVYLCHAFCEVGATKAVTAFASVHRFLVTHPNEVLILSIEDDVSPRDTVEVFRRSGLIDQVYRGSVRRLPTLRRMIDRDQRVLVLVENDPGSVRWMHRQSRVAQETPYRFRTVEELAAPSSCEPNRGGTRGPLLLFNHWVDTSPAPRVTIARQVNAREFLDRRIALCRARRQMTPSILAVDFYATGDAQAVVNSLNGGARGRSR
jgi:hypothetical protein